MARYVTAGYWADGYAAGESGGSTPPTTATLTGPSTGTTGVASGNFTITLDQPALSTITFTPAGIVGVNTFSPANPQITAGNSSVTFTDTAAADGTHVVSITNDAGLSNVGTVNYVTTSPPLATVARPTSDIAAGAWLPSTGSSLAAMLDEVSADSSDYIFTTTAGTTCEVALNPVTLPAQTRKRISYQVWSPTGGGVRAALKQGAVTVASWTHASLPTVPTRFDQYLTDAQVALITDSSALSFTFTSL